MRQYHKDQKVQLVEELKLYDQGELDEERISSLFQRLVDTEYIHALGVGYQKMAQGLIDLKLVFAKK